ncbi:hypothetical protein FO519_009209 [Halicephalobus sp. NKZ332]|nr:hypothetical protein FO519_009209 [Halicephalobus sp. NKZ332]
MMPNFANFRQLGKKIICVGRNYCEHAKELGNAIPTKPMIFLKSTNSYITEGQKVVIPPGCQNLHQEVELGVVISKEAKNIQKDQWKDYIAGYTVALDMTARDFQDEAKKAGAPWFLAKSFDTSCPVGDFIDKSKLKDPHSVEVYCLINGQVKQKCNTDQMIFDIPTLLSYVTQFATLEPGDLLLTGTPAGVCRVQSGDEIEFGLTGITSSKVRIQ